MTTVTKDAVKYTEKDLSESTLATAAVLETRLTIDNKGNGVYAPDTMDALFEQKGLTREQYVQVQEFDADVHRAGAYVQGKLGVPVLKANPELTHITTELPTVGKDKVTFGLKRSAPYTIKDGEGTVTGTGTTWGSVTVDHKSYSAKKRGEMTKISSLISDLAEAQLS